jgi:predicted dienelactone hydrolase
MQTWKKLLVLLALSSLATAAGAEIYDPLAVDPAFAPVQHQLTVQDAARSREIPLRIYLPAEKGKAPVVLFSHGLGGSRDNNVYLGRHWSARGYAAIFLQHAGSDEAVWKDKPRDQRRKQMRQAASIESFLARVRDVPAVLDQLERWNKDPKSPLAGRLDLQHVGMSGHSFGAITTQAVSGEIFPMAGRRFTEARIDAAIAMSPSSPRRGSPKEAFAKVEIPWLLMTGTNETAAIGNIGLESRLAVYPALPPGEKYELVLEGAEHSAFNETGLPGDRRERNPNHHRAILALSTAFWDAYLRVDQEARKWLDGAGPASVLEAKDSWRKK